MRKGYKTFTTIAKLPRTSITVTEILNTLIYDFFKCDVFRYEGWTVACESGASYDLANIQGDAAARKQIGSGSKINFHSSS